MLVLFLWRLPDVISSEPCSTISIGERKGSCIPWGKTNSAINFCTIIFVIKGKLGITLLTNFAQVLQPTSS